MTTDKTDTNRGNLYISVSTIQPDGKVHSRKIADLHHFGTAAWLSKHQWWAAHNGYTVTTEMATTEDVQEYVAIAAQQLAEQVNAA